MSKVVRLEQVTNWIRVLNLARRTRGKEPLNKQPSNKWKAKMILAEHSPIRALEYDFSWEDIKQWVTVHFVRHHEGCEKYVHSQRPENRELEIPRDDLPQGSPNDMDMTCNAQAFINISRKRLCSCASSETREAWKQVLRELRKVDPVLADKCVPECIYRGFCPEFDRCCGFVNSEKFKEQLVKYRSIDYKD